MPEQTELESTAENFETFFCSCGTLLQPDEGPTTVCDACGASTHTPDGLTIETTQEQTRDDRLSYIRVPEDGLLARAVDAAAAIEQLDESRADIEQKDWDSRFADIIKHAREINQAVEYERTGDRIIPPEKTLAETQAGDCCDQSVAIASVLTAYEFHARFVLIFPRDKEVGHAAVEVGIDEARFDTAASLLRSKYNWDSQDALAYERGDQEYWLLIDPVYSPYIGDPNEYCSADDGGLDWAANCNLFYTDC